MKTTKEQRAEWLRYGAGEDAAHEKIITELCDDLDEALADLAKERERAEAEARCAKLEASVSTQTVATFAAPVLGVMCASCSDMGVLYEMHILASRLLVEATEAEDKTKIADAVARLKDVETKREAAQNTASVIAALRAELETTRTRLVEAESTHDELGELKRAIEREDSVENVAREAADVANFVMMIADRYAYGVLCGEYEPRPDRAKGGAELDICDCWGDAVRFTCPVHGKNAKK